MDFDGVSVRADNGALIRAAHQSQCLVLIRETERRRTEVALKLSCHDISETCVHVVHDFSLIHIDGTGVYFNVGSCYYKLFSVLILQLIF